MSPTPSPRPLQFFPIHCGLERKSSPTVRSGARNTKTVRVSRLAPPQFKIKLCRKTLYSCRNKGRGVAKQVPILCPQSFVHHIAEVRSLLRQHRVVALSAFILLKLAVTLSYTCIVHRNEDILALGSIEALQWETRVRLCQNLRPQQELVMLRWLDTPCVNCSTLHPFFSSLAMAI